MASEAIKLRNIIIEMYIISQIHKYVKYDRVNLFMKEHFQNIYNRI